MKVLVTGGAGFVGSHLCERLVKKGHDVMSLDNYFTGSESNHVPGVTYIREDTMNINDPFLPIKDYCPDLIFHLGEYSRVEQSFDDMDIVFKFNKIGTYEVLEYARKSGAKLVYAGSSTKFVEESGYIQSPYAWSKASNTELVMNYGKWFGLNYAITYFYNVYGPREIAHGKYATLIAKFAAAMRQGEPLTVVSPGTQLRNFTHVDDIVDGLIMVGENGYGDEFGIGNSKEYSILEVANLFASSDNIKFLPERRGNRMSSPVITHRTRDLGWNHSRNLEDYIISLKNANWKN